MHAIDTNVLVRLIVRDDPKQAAVADNYVKRGGWVSHLALVEAMWVLSAVYERNSRQIASAIEMLLHHQTLAIQDPDVVSAALNQFLKQPAVSFSDCMLLEIARKAGHLPLGTFDRNLARRSDADRL